MLSALELEQSQDGVDARRRDSAKTGSEAGGNGHNFCQLPIRGFVRGECNFLTTEAESEREIGSEIHHEVRSSLFTDRLFRSMEGSPNRSRRRRRRRAPEEGQLLLVLCRRSRGWRS